MNKEIDHTKLIESALLATGWIVAKHGFTCNAAHWLAKGLKDSGVNGLYIDAILEANEEPVPNIVTPKQL